MDTPVLVAQGVGLLAMCFDLSGAAQKDDRKMVLLSALGCTTFALHYFLLGAYSGMIAELFNATRNVISQTWKNKIIGFLFIGGNAAMILTVDNIVAALPYVAGIIISFTLYNLKGIGLRAGYICGWSVWLTYTIINGSIGGSLMFIIGIFLCATNIYRLRKEVML